MCRKYYVYDFDKGYKENQLYGHGFEAWVVYQRVALRLPYESIVESLTEQFHEQINVCCIPKFMKNLAHYYTDTEQSMTRSLLESPFIHVDETEINIHGSTWYIWVFTDEKHVIFKLTETREAELVHKLLSNYNGILISDFYPAYDSVPCVQQKCWVHLIRDLNNDLLDAPFDTELAYLVSEVRDLIIPIMECIQRHGLQQRKLHKFKNRVKKFTIMLLIIRITCLTLRSNIKNVSFVIETAYLRSLNTMLSFGTIIQRRERFDLLPNNGLSQPALVHQ